MEKNNLKQISDCFEDKSKLEEILNLYLERGIADLRSIIIMLDTYGLDDNEKKRVSRNLYKI